MSEDIKKKLSDIASGMDSKLYLDKPLCEWRPLLANECQVYVYNQSYIAKRFDQINYMFCTQKTAQEILKHNLYDLLRFKYFPKTSDEVEERIEEIVKSFLANIKTSLVRVSFDFDDDCKIIKSLPDGCIAFRNGVYNFVKDEWLFKYEKTRIDHLQNTLYSYDPTYIIMWYMNFDFEPLPFSVNDLTLEEFIEVMKDLDKEHKNYTFELMYNMSHDLDHTFDMTRFKHLCEILGYTCMQSFVQAFVMLIGSGQNGKNSLFDGCFSTKVFPAPAGNDLDSIEEDQFITGALENKSHNFFLETDPEVKTKSKMLKALTGGTLQTIQHKGEDKYTGYINCKFIWSGNDQDKIKFSDNTIGFRRRINLFETWYRWDENKKFLKKADDYYDTTFSEDLHEIKNDIQNYIVYLYFAIYGIISATQNFTRTFKFTETDWKMKYADIDFDLKEQIEKITPEMIYNWIHRYPKNYELGKTLFFDMAKNRIYSSKTLTDLGYNNYEDFVEKFLKDDEIFIRYFVDNECYISIRYIQDIINMSQQDSTRFTSSFKKLYNIQSTQSLYNNRPYVKCTFTNKKLKIYSE